MPEISVSPKWDPRPKEYKLNPEQMKRYLAGEKMEDIRNEGAAAEVTQQQEIPKEEGEKDMGKAKVIGITKYNELLERYENLKFELDKQVKTEKPNKDYETLLKQKDAAIAELRKELEEVKSKPQETTKPLKELAEIENLKAEMERSQGLFEEVLASRDNDQKEIIVLENQNKLLQDALKEKTDLLEERTTLYEDLRERHQDLSKEVYPLKMLAFLKLKREVE